MIFIYFTYLNIVTLYNNFRRQDNGSIAICSLSNYTSYVSHSYCQKTPHDGLLRPKHVVVLCFNILSDNTDTDSISNLMN
jgi:hypothetical protein